MNTPDWTEEHQQIWEGLSRIRRLYRPSHHERAKIIYDCLNRKCLLRPNEEEEVIAHMVLEFLEIENGSSAELGISGHLVRRLQSINAI